MTRPRWPLSKMVAGGPDSVRGFRESRLGPKDSYGRPYGGNLKMVAQSEILFPMPKNGETARDSACSTILQCVFP